MAPRSAIRSASAATPLGQRADLLLDRVDRSLQDGDASRRLDATRARLGAEGDLLDDGPAQLGERGVVADTGRAPELSQALARQVDDGAALRRLVLDRRNKSGFDRFGLRDAGRRHDRSGQAVAVRDRARLVEQDDVDVTGGLDGTAAHRQDVEPRDAIHARDADGRQEAADGGRDEADEQGDERDGVDGRAGVLAEWPQGDGGHQEDDREAGEEDRECDLVRRPLALRALDEGDHPIEERLARVGRHLDDDAVADERRATGD